MPRIPFLAAIIITISCGQAFAQTNPNLPPCYQDKIINTNGQTIRLNSGQVFQVYPGMTNKLAFWLPQDEVKICPIGGGAIEITDLKAKQQIKAIRKN